MCKVAYDIAEAAAAIGVSSKVIADAIAARQITARRIDGQPKMLHADLTAWVSSQPAWYVTS
jgi:Tfp pilus assembly PilM family ATPase